MDALLAGWGKKKGRELVVHVLYAIVNQNALLGILCNVRNDYLIQGAKLYGDK